MEKTEVFMIITIRTSSLKIENYMNAFKASNKSTDFMQSISL